MLFDGKKCVENVSKEQGSFDYIMGMDVDTSASFVKDELYRWGIWFTRLYLSEMSGVLPGARI